MGDGFRVRVRDRVNIRAKGWLGFTYYGPKLLELRLRSGGGFGKKQNRADNHSKSPNYHLRCYLIIGLEISLRGDGKYNQSSC